ncbi:MAG: 1-pyrroline-5-carboxylate dehydrogenase, partial [Firmicutes bacterium]|nr:1-pyrroline-5-carboxylate dehydrogenase [Bacillota bacterium]
MNNGTYKLAMPANEPVLGYMPGSPERLALTRELEKQSAEIIEIPLIIGGKEVRTGVTKDIVMPHDHQHVIARYHMAGEKELKDAIAAALEAKKAWESMPW